MRLTDDQAERRAAELSDISRMGFLSFLAMLALVGSAAIYLFVVTNG